MNTTISQSTSPSDSDADDRENLFERASQNDESVVEQPDSVLPSIPRWAAAMVPFLEMPVVEGDTLLREAAASAWTARRDSQMPEVKFWEAFFKGVAPHFEDITVEEACRRFSIPAEFARIDNRSLKESELALEQSKAAMAAAQAAFNEAKHREHLHRELVLKLRLLVEAISAAEGRKAELEKGLRLFIDFREDQIYSSTPNYDNLESFIRSYGAELSLRAALADHPAQVSRLRAELAKVEAEIKASLIELSRRR